MQISAVNSGLWRSGSARLVSDFDSSFHYIFFFIRKLESFHSFDEIVLVKDSVPCCQIAMKFDRIFRWRRRGGKAKW